MRLGKGVLGTEEWWRNDAVCAKTGVSAEGQCCG